MFAVKLYYDKSYGTGSELVSSPTGREGSEEARSRRSADTMSALRLETYETRAQIRNPRNAGHRRVGGPETFRSTSRITACSVCRRRDLQPDGDYWIGAGD